MLRAIAGVTSAFVIVCVLVPYSSGQEKDGADVKRRFDEGVAEALKKRRPETIRALGQGLARGVSDADVAVLAEEAQGRWKNPAELSGAEKSVRQQLAIWALGHVGTRSSVAALVECALDRKPGGPSMILVAMTEAPEAEARRGLHALLTTRKKALSPAYVRFGCMLFLGAIGNDQSLALLSKAHSNTDDAYVARTLKTRIANLRFKLETLDAEGQKRYSGFELAFWRALSAAPQTRHIEGAYWAAARTVRAKVKDIPFAFIKRKLDPATAVMEEIATATCLCALSKEKRALPSLRQLLKGKTGQTYLRGIALEAIKRINAKP